MPLKSCDCSEEPAVPGIEHRLHKSGHVSCISITANACDAIRSQVIVQLSPNTFSVHTEVNVTYAGANVWLKLTAMQASHPGSPGSIWSCPAAVGLTTLFSLLHTFFLSSCFAPILLSVYISLLSLITIQLCVM
jgi:hypothetical protein